MHRPSLASGLASPSLCSREGKQANAFSSQRESTPPPPPLVAPHTPASTDTLPQLPINAELLPELLEKVFERLDASETGWPERSALVAVAGVCAHWRGIALRFYLPRPWRINPGVSPDFAFPCRLQQPVRATPLSPASRLQSLGTLDSTH